MLNYSETASLQYTMLPQFMKYLYAKDVIYGLPESKFSWLHFQEEISSKIKMWYPEHMY